MNPAVLRPTFRSQLERRYADHLFAQKARGEILDWGYERYVFQIGFDTRLIPDFDVIGLDSNRVFKDTKGPWFPAKNRVKLFAAASAFPEHDFYIVRMTVNGWKEERVRIVVPTMTLREPTA